MKYLVLLCLLFITIYGKPRSQKANTCGYESCPKLNDSFLNVHLIPHSHDDVGWLKTVDQYFYGHGSFNIGVNYIISSVIEALRDHPERRFIQVETAFFWQWWKGQNEETKTLVRQLVNEGRFEIINGAWSMNDEAAAHYQSIIDQFTWGLKIINDTLGECGRPKVGWQIDPFGHSNEMANIFSEIGYEGLFFARLDYRDKERRIKDKNMDFVWEGSSSLGNTSRLFTSIFYDFYTQPATFCWDVQCKDEPIIDDIDSFDYNWERRVQEFKDLVVNQSKAFQTNNLVVPMGGDFTYQSAEMYYSNIDKLIAGFQKFSQDINLVYSTPSCYIKAVHDSAKKNGLKFELKQDDFFPYASGNHTYWTGYFTSRANSKRLERQGNNLLQVTKQLNAFEKILNQKDFSGSITTLKEVMGIMQHHDAITGTEKQHVADDYSKLLDRAMDRSTKGVDQIIIDLLKKTNNNVDDVKIPMTMCLQANMSSCDVSSRDNFTLVVYNPFNKPVTHYVRLPVNHTQFNITGLDGSTVKFDVVLPSYNFKFSGLTQSKYELVFPVKDIPGFGLRYYYLTKMQPKVNDENSPVEAPTNKNYFGTNVTGFELDDLGLLKSVTIKEVKLQMTQNFYYYTGFAGDNYHEVNRSSGAYIFRPNEKDALPCRENASASVLVKVYRGQICDEVHQKFNEYVSQVIRVCKNESYVEFDWIVGPLNVDKLANGIEIVTRFETPLLTNGVFYTDSNGREMMKRQRSFRETFNYTSEEDISGNYYPVTSRIALRSNEMEVAVLTDRAQGGTSLKDGQIELMVQRRLRKDDAFGVGEALNETQYGQGIVTRGSHFLTLGRNSNEVHPQKVQRYLQQNKLLSPWVFLGEISNSNHSLANLKSKLNFEFAPLSSTLDERIQILTMEPWNNGAYLLRLENLVEAAINNTEAKVDLNDLFTNITVVSLEEMNLAANQPAKEIQRMTWNITEESYSGQDSMPLHSKILQKAGDTVVSLGPMQIRTFLVKFEKVIPRDDNTSGKGSYTTKSVFLIILSVMLMLFT